MYQVVLFNKKSGNATVSSVVMSKSQVVYVIARLLVDAPSHINIQAVRS